MPCLRWKMSCASKYLQAVRSLKPAVQLSPKLCLDQLAWKKLEILSFSQFKRALRKLKACLLERFSTTFHSFQLFWMRKLHQIDPKSLGSVVSSVLISLFIVRYRSSSSPESTTALPANPLPARASSIGTYRLLSRTCVLRSHDFRFSYSTSLDCRRLLMDGRDGGSLGFTWERNRMLVLCYKSSSTMRVERREFVLEFS